MKLENFLIGVLAFIAVGIVILTFVTDVYSEHKGLNVSLADDPDTAQLGTLQSELETEYRLNEQLSTELWDKTVGQPGAELSTAYQSDAELSKSALSGLTNVGLYQRSFFIMLESFFSALGIGTTTVFWFFTSAMLVLLAIVMIRVLLPNI